MRRQLVMGLVAALILGPGLITVRGQEQEMTQMQERQQVFGWQLMSEQERQEYRRQMQQMKTEEEREAFRLEHHKMMKERAREMGVTLPDEPGPRGKGMGPGGGMGPGSGGMGGGRR